MVFRLFTIIAIECIMNVIDPYDYFRCTNDILKICCTKILHLKNTNSINNRKYNQTVKTVTLNITQSLFPVDYVRYNKDYTLHHNRYYELYNHVFFYSTKTPYHILVH